MEAPYPGPTGAHLTGTNEIRSIFHFKISSYDSFSQSIFIPWTWLIIHRRFTAIEQHILNLSNQTWKLPPDPFKCHTRASWLVTIFKWNELTMYIVPGSFWPRSGMNDVTEFRQTFHAFSDFRQLWEQVFNFDLRKSLPIWPCPNLRV